MDTDKPNAPAAAPRLLDALHTYRGVVERLVRAGWDADGYKAAADLFLQMQELAVQLPAIHPVWLEVLISRFEFTHRLWECRHAPDAAQALAASVAAHLGALERLVALCAEPRGAGSRSS